MDGIAPTGKLRTRDRAGTPSTLPPDLLAEGVRRLGSLSLLIAVLMAVTAVTLNLITRSPGSPFKVPAFVIWCGAARVVVMGHVALSLTPRSGARPRP